MGDAQGNGDFGGGRKRSDFKIVCPNPRVLATEGNEDKHPLRRLPNTAELRCDLGRKAPHWRWPLVALHIFI